MTIRRSISTIMSVGATCVLLAAVGCSFDVKYPSQYQDVHPETAVPDVGEDTFIPDSIPGDAVGPDIPPPCVSDGDCDASQGSPGECQVWVCANNSCQKKAAQNGNPCTDGDMCTDMDSCLNGRCSGTLMVFCETPDPCAESFCNPSTGTCETNWIPGCNVIPCVEEGGVIDPWGTGGVVPMEGGVSPPIGEFSDCCPGLNPVSDCLRDDDVACIPEMECGAMCECTTLMVCVSCGDGTCSPWETPCSCPQDCWVETPLPECDAVGAECKEGGVWSGGSPEGDADDPDIAMYFPCPLGYAHLDFAGCEMDGAICCVEIFDDDVVAQ